MSPDIAVGLSPTQTLVYAVYAESKEAGEYEIKPGANDYGTEIDIIFNGTRPLVDLTDSPRIFLPIITKNAS